MPMKDDTRKIGVYRIILPSGKIYVGMTCDSFANRWRGHRKELRAGKHHCVGLQRAYNKYGDDSLVFEILESFPKASDTIALQAREVFWWEHFASSGVLLYNGKPSGCGGVFHTDETKAKISSSRRREVENLKSELIRNLGDKLIELRLAGGTYRLIAKELDISYNQVKFLIRYFSLENISLLQDKAPVKVLREQKVAKTLSCENNTCNKEFTSTNSNRKYCSLACSRHNPKTKIKAITSDELSKLYLEEELSTTDIAKLFGVSQPTIYYALKEHGIAVRPKNSYTDRRRAKLTTKPSA